MEWPKKNISESYEKQFIGDDLKRELVKFVMGRMNSSIEYNHFLELMEKELNLSKNILYDAFQWLEAKGFIKFNQESKMVIITNEQCELLKLFLDYISEIKNIYKSLKNILSTFDNLTKFNDDMIDKLAKTIANTIIENYENLVTGYIKDEIRRMQISIFRREKEFIRDSIKKVMDDLNDSISDKIIIDILSKFNNYKGDMAYIRSVLGELDKKIVGRFVNLTLDLSSKFSIDSIINKLNQEYEKKFDENKDRLTRELGALLNLYLKLWNELINFMTSTIENTINDAKETIREYKDTLINILLSTKLEFNPELTSKLNYLERKLDTLNEKVSTLQYPFEGTDDDIRKVISDLNKIILEYNDLVRRYYDDLIREIEKNFKGLESQINKIIKDYESEMRSDIKKLEGILDRVDKDVLKKLQDEISNFKKSWNKRFNDMSKNIEKLIDEQIDEISKKKDIIEFGITKPRMSNLLGILHRKIKNYLQNNKYKLRTRELQEALNNLGKEIDQLIKITNTKEKLLSKYIAQCRQVLQYE